MASGPETNVLLRIDRPDNRFEEAWKNTLKELHGCLASGHIVFISLASTVLGLRKRKPKPASN